MLRKGLAYESVRVNIVYHLFIGMTGDNFYCRFLHIGSRGLYYKTFYGRNCLSVLHEGKAGAYQSVGPLQDFTVMVCH